MLLIMPCCCNIFINWVFAVLKFYGSPVTSVIVSSKSVKCNHSYSGWEPLLGGILQGSALESLLFLIDVNDMPLQIQNGSLLQFADDTCLICYDGDHTQVKDFLSSDWLDGLLQVRCRLMWRNLV